MIRGSFLFALFSFFAYSDTHYARVEPIRKIDIKAEVSGRVTLAKDNFEGRMVTGLIVKIDDKLDKIDLKNSISSIKILKRMIALNRDLLPVLRNNMIRKERLYNKAASINSTSTSQKDSLYASFVSTKAQYFSTKEKILTLENQIISLKEKIASLRDIIDKKSIKVKDRYLYSLDVNSGEFLNIGSKVATLYDISKAKITIFLSDDELKDIEQKSIYIDGERTNLRFNKIYRIADSKNISSYKAEIILKPVQQFSKLVKVEIK